MDARRLLGVSLAVAGSPRELLTKEVGVASRPQSVRLVELAVTDHFGIRAPPCPEAASSAIPCWLAAEAVDQEVHKAAHLGREVAAGRVEGV
jgi:hypothetical protein